MKICPQCGKAFDDTIEVCTADRSKLISIDSSDPDPMLGKLLAGRYRLVRKIGEGGMGAIYRAVHTEMSRTCAIKLLTGLSPGKDDAIARFKREAKMASRIDNVHAVTIYDSGQSEDGMLFLAMEFIDGKPLSRVISEQRVLPIERVIHLTNQICQALAAAHALGIVHRDLKPDNIMITRKGAENDFVKVLDFGIAKTMADDEGDNLTKTGFVLGTPVYMSPEQLLGEKLDPRSDIYSLAIIVYEMLSGRLPYEGDNPQAVMMKRVMSEPIPLRAVSPSMSEAVERAVMAGLERNRDSRTAESFTFASELSQALHSSTQIIGSAVTGPVMESGDGRATREWAGSQTNADSNPVFTRQAEPPSASTRPDVNTWAKTEVSHAPVRPPSIPPTVYAAPPTTPMNPDPVTSPDQHSTSNDGRVFSQPASRTNKLVWAGGAVVVAVIAAILYLILSPAASTGYTLVVKGAPGGSQVYINETKRDAVLADGALRLVNLDPGQTNVRVSHEGYADFIATITGVKGETQTCEAQLLPEIDYKGLMVPIPAGDFIMGSGKFEPDEGPEHNVALQAYYIDKYEVTNAQYKQFCDETQKPYPPNPPFDPDYFTAKPDYPVLGVTFEDALAYASWANKRLPTEEEWEKAASWDPIARKKRLYAWGDESGGRGNIATGEPSSVTDAKGDRSPYGVWNMSGNALEWADAPYKPYVGNRTQDSAFNKDERIIRGASFLKAAG
ncbi:MAG: bifunctional serine/threonine-protein kinase/formylglycine-generating enzyme family protein, partial [Blastocatellia bacterium]